MKKLIIGLIILIGTFSSCAVTIDDRDPFPPTTSVTVSIPEYTFYYLWYNGVYVRRECLPYRSRYVYYYQGPRAYFPRNWKPRTYTRTYYPRTWRPRNYVRNYYGVPSRPHINNSMPIRPSRSLSPHHPTPSPSRNSFGQHR